MIRAYLYTAESNKLEEIAEMKKVLEEKGIDYIECHDSKIMSHSYVPVVRINDDIISNPKVLSSYLENKQ